MSLATATYVGFKCHFQRISLSDSTNLEKKVVFVYLIRVRLDYVTQPHG